MGQAQIFSIRNPVLGDDGAPLGGGSIDVFAAGTTTRVASYSDATRTATNQNPVLLPSSGRASVWVDVDVDVVVKDSEGNTVYSESGLNPNADIDIDSGLAVNGAFETQGTGDATTALGWVTENVGGDGSVERTASQGLGGTFSMRFTSTASNSGGGDLVSEDLFQVRASESLIVEFYLKNSNQLIDVDVDVNWFDSSGAALSSSAVYTNSTNNPTFFQKILRAVTAPANAVFAKLRFSIAKGFTTGTVDIDRVAARYGAVSIATINQPVVLDSASFLSNIEPDNIERDYIGTSGTINITLSVAGFVIGQNFRVHNQGATVVNVNHGVTVNGSASGTIATNSGETTEFLYTDTNTWIARTY